MAQKMTIQCVVICTLALSVSVFSVIGVGIGVAESGTNETEAPTITSSGEGEDIFSNKNKVTLANISIDYSQKYDNSSKINVYISMSELEKRNIGTKSAEIGSYNISGSSVSNISKLDNQTHTVFKIQVNPNNETEAINFDKIEILNVDTSKINSTISSRYKLGVSSNNNSENYSDLKSKDQTTRSTSFDIVVSSVEAPDQATISSQILADSETSPGVTLTNFVSNNDSIVIVTQGYNGTRLAGFERQSATSVSGRQNTTIGLRNIGGKKTVHVIPDSDINMTNYDYGEHIPKSKLDAAIATDTVHVFVSRIKFPDQVHNRSVNSTLALDRVSLRDLNGDKTPYIVSIHPITTDGDIVDSTIYGHSNRLTGKKEGIEIDLKYVFSPK
ncbi:hypothetical protein [Halorubrum halophilum]|uniref:hypothetical protein n=1 Tax=Halorubrum halophilum TaxID=413816 RepID=UPI0012AC2DD8|nr:hypothetical protein [Halorubrum halophilum]